jgi:Ca2+-binding EF-hand superfamily protein
MFDQKQIAEFKEAFSMIDHDQDGFIDKDDLKDMLASLGILISSSLDTPTSNPTCHPNTSYIK